MKIIEEQRKLESDIKWLEDFFQAKPKLKSRLINDFHHYRLTFKEWIKEKLCKK